MKTGTRSAVGVVDRHGGVLQADGAVRHDHHRLAFDLGVAVRHGDRGFFVAAGEQFGILVAAVIDDGFVQAAEAGAGIGGAIFDAERLDHVDHEVGANAQRRLRLQRGLLRHGDGRSGSDQSRRARSGVAKEAAAACRILLRHDASTLTQFSAI